jgi:hypothetical protein
MALAKEHPPRSGRSGPLSWVAWGSRDRRTVSGRAGDRPRGPLRSFAPELAYPSFVATDLSIRVLMAHAQSGHPLPREAWFERDADAIWEPQTPGGSRAMTGELWVVAAALALVALIGLLMGRRLVRFTLEIFGLKVDAEGDRPRGGVQVTRARAARHIIAESRGSGQTRVDRATAGGDIRASHTAELADEAADRTVNDGEQAR